MIRLITFWAAVNKRPLAQTTKHSTLTEKTDDNHFLELKFKKKNKLDYKNINLNSIPNFISYR